MKKREFLVAGVGIGAVLPRVLASTTEEKTSPGQAGKESVFRVNPYLQNVSETAATVVWLTRIKCHSWVEWGTSEALGSQAQTIVDGQVTANNTLNKIALPDLEPGKTYWYRICSRVIKKYNPYGVDWGATECSAVQSFSTPAAKSDSLKCVLFSDIHDRIPTFNALLDQIKTFDYDLSIFNGDCFNDPRNEEQVYPLLDTYGRGVRAAERPVIYLRGNHEIRGAYSRQWPSVVSNPGGKQYFTMNRGPVHFVFMDCGEDKPDLHWAYSGLNDFEGFHREQAIWLEKEIETPEFKKARYRVLVHHIPIYGLNPKSHNPWKSLWGPIMNRAGFDLSIHGHLHRACLVHPPMTAGNHNFPVVIGGGPSMENGCVTLLEASAKELKVTLLGTEGQHFASHTVPARA